MAVTWSRAVVARLAIVCGIRSLRLGPAFAESSSRASINALNAEMRLAVVASDALKYILGTMGLPAEDEKVENHVEHQNEQSE